MVELEVRRRYQRRLFDRAGYAPSCAMSFRSTEDKTSAYFALKTLYLLEVAIYTIESTVREYVIMKKQSIFCWLASVATRKV